MDAFKGRERVQQDALFRYQLICRAFRTSWTKRGKVVRAIAGRDHDGPFGGRVQNSRETSPCELA